MAEAGVAPGNKYVTIRIATDERNPYEKIKNAVDDEQEDRVENDLVEVRHFQNGDPVKI